MEYSAAQVKEWEGFKLTAYTLDENVLNLALSWVKPTTEGKKEQEPTTVGEVYRSLADQQVKLDGTGRWLRHIKISTASDELEVAGPVFNLEILYEILSLRKDGSSPFEANWFWYTRDFPTNDYRCAYSFFVVYDNRIVNEQAVFNDDRGSGFDPSVFVPAQDPSWTPWFGSRELSEARQRFWRRKFHKETITGQLMALRSDRPDLWAYLDESWPGRQATLRLLSNIRYLLWTVIVLLALVLIRLWW